MTENNNNWREDKPGVAANIFEPLSKAQINVDMVIQTYLQIKKLQILLLLLKDDVLNTQNIKKQ